MMKRKLNKMMRGESGQALIIALVLMLVGSIILTPLLAYMGTGLKTGREVYEERMYGQYAADAGVEDALFKIRVDDSSLPGAWDGVWTDEDYVTPYPYDLPQAINNNDVNVIIKPYWILNGLESDSEGKTPHSDIVVVGDTIGTVEVDDEVHGLYKIAINYDNSIGELFIKRIGAWLPAGYEYVEDSSNLEQDDGEDYYCVPETKDFRGGTAITWEYGTSGIKYEYLPGGEDGKAIVTFEFTPQGNPLAAFSWVKTNREDISLSWDADIKIYQITSTASGGVAGKPVTTTVEAYAIQSDPRKLGSGREGDYVAVGNSLLAPTTDIRKRDQLLIGSNATVTSGTDIPANATVDGAYLYWSGWIDYHYFDEDDGKPPPPPPGPPPGGGAEEIDELNYNEYDPDDLTDLVETYAKVNVVSFGVGSSMTDITADTWEVIEVSGDPWNGTWFYNCLYDATPLVKGLIDADILGDNGSGTYTLEHAEEVLNLHKEYGGGDYDPYYFELFDEYGFSTNEYTGYPLGTPAWRSPDGGYDSRYEAAYAGWSLIIFYTSPDTKGHQLYLYDIATPGFNFTEGWGGAGGTPNPDFDGDGSPGGTIGGFLVPPRIAGEVDAAKLTCFVGEGDEGGVYVGDYMKVNGDNQSNSESPENDVWNARSPGLAVPGVDIDTFDITWSSGTIGEGDTEAQIDLPTGSDGFVLIYIILSFRSEIITGGAISYVYVGG